MYPLKPKNLGNNLKSQTTCTIRHIYYPAVILILLLVVYAENIAWLWSRWLENPDYSHGPLIPLISAFIIYQKRDQLKRIQIQGSNAGLFVIFLAVSMYIIGHRASVNFLLSYSLIINLVGILLFLYGKEMVFRLIFPILYLFFMVPFWSGAIIEVSNGLKVFSSLLSSTMIGILGYPIFRDGVILNLSNGVLEVADPCSGIRSLIALLSLATVLAYFTPTRLLNRIIIVLSAIPIAVFGNTLRVVFFAVVLEEKGIVITEGPLHTISGLLVFVFALFVLFGVSRWMVRV